MPEVILFEGYTEGFRPGGIEAANWIKNYSLYLQGFNLNLYRPEVGIFPSVPAIDEDGDGDFKDEVPLMDKGDPATFLDDGFPPRYADGKKRSGHYYFLATREHAGNPTYSGLNTGMPFIDSHYKAPNESMTYSLASPGAWIPEVVKSGIPIYHLGGWFDGFCKGTFKLFPTSWVFKKGHRVRIAIAGADYPNFSLNPGLAPHGKPEECPDTQITIHRTGKYASRIELPIILTK
jgi:hypothetical protein